jgi:hypothetical protein
MTASPGIREDLVLSRERRLCTSPEVIVALGAFVIFAILVLTKATAMLEPDDYAYRVRSWPSVKATFC